MTRAAMSDLRAMNRIAKILSAREWGPEDLERIADVVRDTGRDIDEPPAGVED